jgi:hypothetical protein
MDHPSPAQQWDLTFSGVYRITPDLGTMTMLNASGTHRPGHYT